jgi:CTP:molybdopterin cytidylyltransferase MocA
MAMMNNHEELMPFSVIIPAAGISERMGRDKAFLEHINGQSFAGHLISSYSAAGAQIVVIIGNTNRLQLAFENVPFIQLINHHVEYGRSYSIFLGLQKVPEGCACFIQNIDNPFVESDLLKQMIALADPDGFVVPEWNGHGGHPILLGRNVVQHIQGLKDFADFRDVLKAFRRIALPYRDERILWNINTPEDYLKFLRIGNRH